MSEKDPRIDTYIARSADFAKPILNHLRALVHAACPEVEETMKWSFPHFDYKGMLCSMAAFKQHCSFGFWKGTLIFGQKKDSGLNQRVGMGQFGRITTISDLPNKKVLIGYIRKAVQLNEAGIKSPGRTRPKERKELIVPDDLLAGLRKNKEALAAFESFSYTNKKDYVEWLTEAKREETRKRRLATAIDWMAEGKPRNWKYINC